MIRSETFRLFVSSTFDDFKKERDILRNEVFPEVRKYYEEKGHRFQPIDLRWGIDHEAQVNHKTLEICLDEVRSCKSQDHSIFLVMLGDRYGWVPLPYAIEKKEFETLLHFCPTTDKDLLQNWYLLDLNQIPHSYILRERDQSAFMPTEWNATEIQMRNALQNAARETLPIESQRKYFQSATEAEIVEGILSYQGISSHQRSLIDQNPELELLDSKSIFGFFRSINQNMDILPSKPFLSDDVQKAFELKEAVKAHILPKNTLEIYTTQLSKTSLNYSYLTSFKDAVTTFLKKQMTFYDLQTTHSLDQELKEQSSFAAEKRKEFIGRHRALSRIRDYLGNDDAQPLLIHGPSGKGKSALIAKAIEDSRQSIPHLVVYRFVGVSPKSSNSIDIWNSIFEELNTSFNKKQKSQYLSSEDNGKEPFLKLRDRILKINEPTVVFIDGIDKLQNQEYFHWLPQNLPKHLKIILSALDDKNYIEDSKNFHSIQQKTKNLLKIPDFTVAQGTNLLKRILKNSNRALQKHQIDYFQDCYRKVRSPLYVQVAAEEIKSWKSFDGTPYQLPKKYGSQRKLSLSQKSIILEFISNLSTIHFHKKEFVNRVLGYMLVSKTGISEYELLSLLNSDANFVQWVAPDSFNIHVTKNLPDIIWIRLYRSLLPFLSKNSYGDRNLHYFFHREFENAVTKLKHQKNESISAITEIQKTLLFKNRQNSSFQIYDSWIDLYINFLIRFVELHGVPKRSLYASFLEQQDLEWQKGFLSLLNDLGKKSLDQIQTKDSFLYIKLYENFSRTLYEVNPKQWDSDYATSLVNMSAVLFKINQNGDAIEHLEEAIPIAENLFQQNSYKWAYLYTDAMRNLATAYYYNNRPNKTIEIMDNCIPILAPFFEKDPSKWANAYLSSRSNWAFAHFKLKRTKSAIKIQEFNRNIAEKLFTDDPEKWSELYTRTLNNLAFLYKDSEKINEAILLEKRSVNTLKALFHKNPDVWRENYNRALINLANSLNRKHKTEDAIVFLKESIAILKYSNASNMSRWGRLYTKSLNNLAYSYFMIQEKEKSISTQKKSNSILKKIYAQNPEGVINSYLTGLSNLARFYTESNRLKKALTQYQNKKQLLIKHYGKDSKDVKTLEESIHSYQKKVRNWQSDE